MIITGGRRVILFRLILNILEQDQLIFFYVEQKKERLYELSSIFVSYTVVESVP